MGMVISQEVKGWRSKGGGIARNFREDTNLIYGMKRSLAQLRAGKSVIEGERVGDCRCNRKGTSKLRSWGSMEDTTCLALKRSGDTFEKRE